MAHAGVVSFPAMIPLWRRYAAQPYVLRIGEIEHLDEDIKKYLYFFIDNTIQNTKAKKALAS